MLRVYAPSVITGVPNNYTIFLFSVHSNIHKSVDTKMLSTSHHSRIPVIVGFMRSADVTSFFIFIESYNHNFRTASSSSSAASLLWISKEYAQLQHLVLPLVVAV